MVPAYILAIIIFLLTFQAYHAIINDQPRVSRRTIVVTIVGVIALILIALPPVLFQFHVCQPRQVRIKLAPCRTILSIIAQRDLQQNPSDKRESDGAGLVSRIACAERTDRSVDGIGVDIAAPVMANYIHLPSFMLDHLSLTRTNAYPNASVSNKEARYPVVVYSHGWNGFRTINANQMEALASHGYIAVSIDHTYGALVTVFQDGRVVLNNPAALPSNVSEDEAQRAREGA